MNAIRFPVFIALLALVGCERKAPPIVTGPPPVVLPANYEWLNASDADALLRRSTGIGIIDVRDDGERNTVGTLPGAISMPFFQAQSNQFSALDAMDHERTWLVYCAIGGRSEVLAKAMADRKFAHVFLLRGGFNAWQAKGYQQPH